VASLLVSPFCQISTSLLQLIELAISHEAAILDFRIARSVFQFVNGYINSHLISNNQINMIALKQQCSKFDKRTRGMDK